MEDEVLTIYDEIRDKPGGKASRGVPSLFESQMFIFLSKFFDNIL